MREERSRMRVRKTKYEEERKRDKVVGVRERGRERGKAGKDRMTLNDLNSGITFCKGFQNNFS